MSIIPRGKLAFSKLTLKAKTGKCTYTHISQPLYKMEQQGGGAAEAHSKSTGWTLPAMLVLLGLSFSTFSTHQLVSGQESIKMWTSASKN